MARTIVVKNRFNGGEVGPKLHGAVDLAKYQTGLEICSNMIPLNDGSVIRKPGFQIVVHAYSNSTKSWLIPFVFKDTQAYMLEFNELIMRVMMRDGYLRAVSGGTPLEITSPFAAADLPKLQHAQTGDLMYLAHPDYQPKKLTRTSHSSWTFSNIGFRNGPFLPENSTAITMTASTTSGVGTLTASSAFFDAGHDGALFRLDEEDRDQYEHWEPDTAYSTGAVVRYAENVYSLVGAGATSGSVAPVHLEGEAYDGETSNCNWLYLHSGHGVVQVSSVTSSTVVNIVVVSTLPADVTSSGSGTAKWREGAFSTYRGWPTAVALFDQRLWWAKDNTVWGSVAGDFENYKLGALADDGVQLAINSPQAQTIRSLVGGRSLTCHDRKPRGGHIWRKWRRQSDRCRWSDRGASPNHDWLSRGHAGGDRRADLLHRQIGAQAL